MTNEQFAELVEDLVNNSYAEGHNNCCGADDRGHESDTQRSKQLVLEAFASLHAHEPEKQA